MKKLITQAVATKAKAANKPYQLHDPLIPGFILRVQPSGRKIWKLIVKRKPQTLGEFPQVTVAMAKERARQIMSGEVEVRGPVPTLQQFIDEYFNEYAEAHHARGYETMRHLHSIGVDDRRLDEITVADIEKFRTARIKGSMKISSINRTVSTLKAALQRAVDWDLIPTNPLTKIKPMKVDVVGVVRYLCPDEEERIYAALSDAEPWLRAITTVALNSGLRRAELFSLTWMDIDMKRQMLTVHGHRAKSKQTRHVPLNETALNALRQWRGGVAPMGNVEVFGQMDIRSYWKRLLRRSDIQSFRFHDCRHHFASKLVMAGVPLNTVRELLGHADLKMTLRYAHLASDNMADAVNLIG